MTHEAHLLAAAASQVLQQLSQLAALPADAAAAQLLASRLAAALHPQQGARLHLTKLINYLIAVVALCAFELLTTRLFICTCLQAECPCSVTVMMILLHGICQ